MSNKSLITLRDSHVDIAFGLSVIAFIGNILFSITRNKAAAHLLPLSFVLIMVCLRFRWLRDYVFTPILFSLVVLVSLHCWVATGKWYLAVLALSAVGLVFAKLYLPVTYTIDEDGLHQSIWRFRRLVKWTLLERAELREGGLLLLPQARNALLTRLWAIFVPCDEQLDTAQTLIETYAPWAATWAR